MKWDLITLQGPVDCLGGHDFLCCVEDIRGGTGGALRCCRLPVDGTEKYRTPDQMRLCSSSKGFDAGRSSKNDWTNIVDLLGCPYRVDAMYAKGQEI